MQRRQYGYKVFSNSETHYDSSVNAVTIGLNTAFIFRGSYTIKWTNNDILAIAKWWLCLDEYEYTSLVHTELFLNLSSDTLAQSWSNGEYVDCLAVSRNSDGINLQQVEHSICISISEGNWSLQTITMPVYSFMHINLIIGEQLAHRIVLFTRH